MIKVIIFLYIFQFSRRFCALNTYLIPTYNYEFMYFLFKHFVLIIKVVYRSVIYVVKQLLVI